jgi:NTE family protein
MLCTKPDAQTAALTPDAPGDGRRRACLTGLAGLLALAVTGCGSLVGPQGSVDAPEAAPPEMRPPRVGLALGGGAARGFAHVGVIQVLEANGVRPDLVVGTSAGSLVGALYASGMGGAALEQAALQMEEAAIADWTLPFFNRGVLRGEALARYVNQQVQGRQLHQMPIPLGVVATELTTGQPIVFRRGDTGTAVRASSAVPGVFMPVRIGDRDYVDGGLVAPVPVQQARQMGAELVIAVDISSAPEGNPASDTFRILLQTFTIMGQSINRYALAQADVVVRPALDGVGSADFAARQRSLEAGRAAMRALLPRLQEQLQLKRRPVPAAPAT